MSIKKYDKNGYLIYQENENGFWIKKQFDDDGRLLLEQDSDGNIERISHRKDGSKYIYFRDYLGNSCTTLENPTSK